jgi:arginase
MDAPTIQPKFLKNGSDLGIVAVGFSGGQVNMSESHMK